MSIQEPTPIKVVQILVTPQEGTLMVLDDKGRVWHKREVLTPGGEYDSYRQRFPTHFQWFLVDLPKE